MEFCTVTVPMAVLSTFVECSKRYLIEHITMLQYADDAAVPSHSAAGLQRLVTSTAD